MIEEVCETLDEWCPDRHQSEKTCTHVITFVAPLWQVGVSPVLRLEVAPHMLQVCYGSFCALVNMSRPPACVHKSEKTCVDRCWLTAHWNIVPVVWPGYLFVVLWRALVRVQRTKTFVDLL